MHGQIIRDPKRRLYHVEVLDEDLDVIWRGPGRVTTEAAKRAAIDRLDEIASAVWEAAERSRRRRRREQG